MFKNIRKHWILWLFAAFTLSLGIGFPDVEITLSGGLAWLLIVGIYFVAFIATITNIKGGEVTYSSKGLIPIIREWRRRKKSNGG